MEYARLAKVEFGVRLLGCISFAGGFGRGINGKNLKNEKDKKSGAAENFTLSSCLFFKNMLYYEI
jgi:hypothetical protein